MQSLRGGGVDFGGGCFAGRRGCLGELWIRLRRGMGRSGGRF